MANFFRCCTYFLDSKRGEYVLFELQKIIVFPYFFRTCGEVVGHLDLGPNGASDETHTQNRKLVVAIQGLPCGHVVQGLSSQLPGLQIEISQPPDQLKISLKYQYVLYLVQFYTYFFINCHFSI